MTESNPYRSAADRAREDRRTFPLRHEINASAMATARANRQARTQDAAAAVVALAHRLAGNGSGQHVPDHVRWAVRGEPRNRATFGFPHPADFRGGLPLPAEYPSR
jgi:hypothetical protein